MFKNCPLCWLFVLYYFYKHGFLVAPLCIGLTLRLAGCECWSWLHWKNCSVGEFQVCHFWSWLGYGLVWSEAGWQVFWFWAYWEGLWCRSSSAIICAYLRTIWYGLKSGMELVSTCPGLGGSWERLFCQPRLAATTVGLKTLWWLPCCQLRPVATCAQFMVILFETTFQAKTSCGLCQA